MLILSDQENDIHLNATGFLQADIFLENGNELNWNMQKFARLYVIFFFFHRVFWHFHK